MNEQLLALIAKHQLQIQWENPNDTADELIEADDKEPCTLSITAANGTVWSADYEDSEEGRTQILQQFLLEAPEQFVSDDEEYLGETLDIFESKFSDPEDESDSESRLNINDEDEEE